MSHLHHENEQFLVGDPIEDAIFSNADSDSNESYEGFALYRETSAPRGKSIGEVLKGHHDRPK
jgi:hypothetical protein